MKRLLFVYNPHAGKGLLRPKVSDIVDLFVKAGYEVSIYPTQAYHDAYRKIVEDTQEYDMIVCSGGDGTIDEVVTAVMKKEKRVPIGYIPAGTTNDFANSLKIPKKIMAAADNAVNGTLFPCDVGWFNDGIFVYIAAFGLFTDVSYQTKQQTKNALGHLAYVLEGTKRLFNVPSYHIKVTYDGEEIEEDFVFGMVTNSKSVAGFRSMIGKNVHFDDGVFEVTLIKTPKTPLELQEIMAALLIEQIDSKYMYTFKAKHVSFMCDEEIPWTLDGEFGGNQKDVTIRNEQKAVEIMVPEKHVKSISIEEKSEEKNEKG